MWVHPSAVFSRVGEKADVYGSRSTCSLDQASVQEAGIPPSGMNVARWSMRRLRTRRASARAECQTWKDSLRAFCEGLRRAANVPCPSYRQGTKGRASLNSGVVLRSMRELTELRGLAEVDDDDDRAGDKNQQTEQFYPWVACVPQQPYCDGESWEQHCD